MLQTDYIQEYGSVFGIGCAFYLRFLTIYAHFKPILPDIRPNDLFSVSQFRNRQETNVKEIFEYKSGAGKVLQQLCCICRIVFIYVSLLRYVISYMLHKHTVDLSLFVN